MTRWKPPLLPGLFVGAAALGLLLIVEAFVLRSLFGREFDLGSFFLSLLAICDLALMAAIGYLLYGLTRLDYSIDSETLAIRWGAVRHALPLSTITDVFTTFKWQEPPGNSGINWPGYHVGRGTGKETGNLLFFATSRSPDNLTFVVTREATYAISPVDRDTFINTLNRCRTRPVGRDATPTVSKPWLFSLPFWQDRVVQAMLPLAIVANAAIFAYVSYKFPTLPPVLPLHYNAMGEIDFLGTRAESFKIPSIGTAALLANFVVGLVLHSRERLATILLLSTAVLVQGVLLVATVRILY